MLATIIQRAILQGIPLLFGSTGEIITEKSGNLNLGIPGIMTVGGVCGGIGAFYYESSLPAPVADHINPVLAILIPLLCSLLGSLAMGLIYAFLTVTLRANQNVTGLALTMFGTGVGDFFGGSITKLAGSETASFDFGATSKFFCATLPFADKLGWFGTIFLSYGFLTYVAIAIAIVVSIVFKRTRVGLNLRAVGEAPATADAAGINVTKYKYFAIAIGSMIAGLGGFYYAMVYMNGGWSNSSPIIERGWLAIALVIFALWKPNIGIPGSILFGGLYILYVYIPGLSSATRELFKMLPYVVTILVLVLTSIRKRREDQPPASLGMSYFREER